SKSVYQSSLPDFMVWNQVKILPLFWWPFHSAAFTLLAIVLVPALFGFAFGYLAFRSRIRGVYFSIITQALALSAWLVFNRNEMNLGGTNGLADFKTAFGFPLNQPGTQRGLYVVTALALVAAYVLCRWITLTRAGNVLGAIGVNWIQSWLTTSYPDLWLLFLGGLFMGAVLFFPDGIVGALGRLTARARRLLTKRGVTGSTEITGPSRLEPGSRTASR